MTSVFATLEPAEITEVTTTKSCHQIHRGDAVFSEGQYPRGLHCIHHGHHWLCSHDHGTAIHDLGHCRGALGRLLCPE
jgi:hypothetical protein